MGPYQRNWIGERVEFAEELALADSLTNPKRMRK
jgi:hypothetical protein